MSDLPINSIGPNPAQGLGNQNPNAMDDTVANLKNILNQPVGSNTSTDQTSNDTGMNVATDSTTNSNSVTNASTPISTVADDTQTNTQNANPASNLDDTNVDTIVSPPKEAPLIQIDLKKSYKKPVVNPPTYAGGSYSSSPFGAPRPSEYYEPPEQNPNKNEQVETVVSPEKEKSPEIIQPEKQPNPENEKEVVPPADLPVAQVVDLRKPSQAPTPKKKKDVLPTASPLTLKANTEEDNFISSILGAHGN